MTSYEGGTSASILDPCMNMSQSSTGRVYHVHDLASKQLERQGIFAKHRHDMGKNWHANIRCILAGRRNSRREMQLKCHYYQILDTHFLRFPTQKVFPSYLGKFQSITNIRTHVFLTFISDSLRPPLVFLVPSLD